MGIAYAILIPSVLSMYDRQELFRGINKNYKHKTPFRSFPFFLSRLLRSDDLLESTVDGRPDSRVLPEVDCRHRALGDALRGELELLQWLLVNPKASVRGAGAKRTL